MKRIFTLILCALVGSLTLMATIYTPKTVPNPKNAPSYGGTYNYVANPDSIIPAEYVTELNRLCTKLDSLTDVELAVVVLDSIGDADAHSFGLELFNTWGIGKKDRNTGILMLLVLHSSEGRRIQFNTGDGIEHIMTDADCDYVIDVMLDVFHTDESSYGPMLVAGVKHIGRRLAQEETRNELLLQTPQEEPSGAPWSWLSWVVAAIGAFFGLSEWAESKCPRCKSKDIKHVKTDVIKEANYKHGGEHVLHYQCRNCGKEFTNTVYPERLLTEQEKREKAERERRRRERSERSSSSSSWGGGHSSGGGAGRSF